MIDQTRTADWSLWQPLLVGVLIGIWLAEILL